jgi:hypothetical protein
MSADEYANQREQQLQWQLAAQSNAYNYTPQPEHRPKSIDPKAKLSDKAALLLSVNHLLTSPSAPPTASHREGMA